MSYGWLTPSRSTREYQRVVRHEFGHALGMIREHQNPAQSARFPWDKPKVYAYYAQQGWSPDDVDFNIFDVYDEDEKNSPSSTRRRSCSTRCPTRIFATGPRLVVWC
jgi:hypothetical protein